MRIRSLILAFATALVTPTLAQAFAQTPAPASQTAAPASTRPPPTLAERSLAAGYKALFHCNGRYAAGLTVEQVERDEIRQTYRDYEWPFTFTSAPTFNDAAKTVSVTYAPQARPRYAVWRDHFGCIVAPPGMMDVVLERLPRRATPSPTPTGPSPRVWPQGDAPGTGKKLSRRQQAAIDAVFARAFDGTYGSGSVTTAVLVASPDALLAERYHPDYGPFTPQRTWSAAKTLSATLIGARIHEGRLRRDQRPVLPEWSAPDDPRGAITLEHLLHMASGLDPSPAGNRTDEIYFGGGLVAQHASRGALLSTRGTVFTYANNDTMNAVRLLGSTFVSREEFWDWTATFLDRLGMTRTYLGADWQGDYVMASQVWTTARDLARLGVLYLNDGVAGGSRFLTSDWIAYMATPAPAQPQLVSASGEQLPGYGAQVWLWGERHGLPAGSFAAQGNRGQYLMIIPARNLVIVRRGVDGPGAGFDVARFSADVLKALDAR
jgi:CubicO group peptidase (beta-lactamase class C family)